MQNLKKLIFLKPTVNFCQNVLYASEPLSLLANLLLNFVFDKLEHFNQFYQLK